MSPSPLNPLYVHGRDLLPIRIGTPRRPNPRIKRLLAAEDRLRQRVAKLDRLLVRLSIERRRLLHDIAHVHDELRPSAIGARGRRRRALSFEEPLPPTAKRPTQLWGRALRAVCLAFLQQAKTPLTLRQLHATLHRAGYAIAHAHPAKALADALGHEADHGRAKRVARATYAAAPPGHMEAPSTTLPDW
ncbi:MAG: hypothetical protein QOJ19_1091 [Acidimicrobiia bacterium]|nr:hypothetical protein [Acidimicrobiia bacterium]